MKKDRDSGPGGGDDGGDENKLIAERRAKLSELRKAGQAFPNDFRRDALAGELHASFGERSAAWLDANPTRVKVGGRLLFRRVMGKASFARRSAISLFSSLPLPGSLPPASRCFPSFMTFIRVARP